MIRRVQLNLNYANVGKLMKLNELCTESKRVVNLYISEIWKQKDFSSTFISFKVDTWLSARLQQCLGKQALEIVKSQRKKKKKSKPVFKNTVFNFDERFVDFKFNENSFDIWIKFSSIGRKLKINFPSKKHKHFQKFFDFGWTMKKSTRLRQVNDKYFLDVYFEKEESEKKTEGQDIGIDIGYKKLIACSDGTTYGTEIENLYKKISRKKQNSKSFVRALKERDYETNRLVKQIPLSRVKKIIVEDLKNVKKSTKGKLRKVFVNKLQRWTYPKVLCKLSFLAEESGIELVRVDPAYTSQTCSRCGFSHPSNRVGEKFKCEKCNFETDADVNASVNILHLGVYGPQALHEKCL